MLVIPREEIKIRKRQMRIRQRKRQMERRGVTGKEKLNGAEEVGMRARKMPRTEN